MTRNDSFILPSLGAHVLTVKVQRFSDQTQTFVVQVCVAKQTITIHDVTSFGTIVCFLLV